VLVAVIAAGLATPALAGASSFRDDFTSFDANRWSATGHLLGRSVLDPLNVSVAGGVLSLLIPGGTVNGGEVQSKTLYKYGSYGIRMRLPNAPSSITGFFLYKPPDYQSEIDIEVYNDSSGRMMVSTCSGGAQTNTRTILLPFDPTAGFHEYWIDYAANGVRFRVDRQLVQAWSRGVPRTDMYLFANAWFPSWLAGQAPTADRSVSIDWIQYPSLEGSRSLAA
jgi:endo-1,3-1,4-beta-glycanase ExoK